MVVVIFVMVTKVLPVFSQIYEQLGSTLTGSAQPLMTISNFLNKYMLILVALFVVLIIAGYLWKQSVKNKTLNTYLPLLSLTFGMLFCNVSCVTFVAPLASNASALY